MTTYYQPLKRIDEDRWDMTSCTGSTRPRPIGYCVGWEESNPWENEEPGIHDAGFRHRMIQLWQRDREKKEPFKDKFHSDGHATEEEALECWHEFLLDLRLRFYDDPNSKKKCRECDEWTQGRAEVQGYTYMFASLCPKHQTRECAKRALFER